MNWYYFFGGIFAIGIVWLVYEFVTAPEGYEDRSGFHYGQRNVRSDGGMDVTNGEQTE